jgi:hypothetical protein
MLRLSKAAMAVLVAATAALSACSNQGQMIRRVVGDAVVSNTEDVQTPPDLAGDVLDGGVDAAGDVGAPDLMHGNGPMVTIIDPADGSRFSPGAVIAVKAMIVPRSGSMPIDRNTVFAYLAGAPLSRPVGLTETNQTNIFAGSVSSANVAPGDYTLEVYASDIQGNQDYATVLVHVGDGPEIQVIRPNQFQALRDQLVVEFNVVAHGGDVGPADVSAISLGTPVTLANMMVDAATTHYEGTLDLSTFAAIEGGQIVTITAKDANNVVTQVIVNYEIDVSGPVIDIQQPAPAGLYTNALHIVVNLKDIAGVQQDSTVATLTNGGRIIVDAMSHQPIDPILLLPSGVDLMGQGAYVADFDARRIPKDIQFPTIVVTARDLLGNESQKGHEFAIDDVGPIIDMDPALTQIYSPGRPKPIFDPTCITQFSTPFDPLGDGALDDLPQLPKGSGQYVPVPQVRHPMALAFDDTRRANGSRFGIDATIDVSTMRMYVLADTSRPLVVDTDMDSVCDTVNPDVVPTPGEPPQLGKAIELRMAAVPPGGDGAYHHEILLPDGGTACVDDDPPLPLAPNAGDNTFTASLNAPDGTPAVYAIIPVEADRQSVLALGDELDFGNDIPEGWVCLAVAASDKIGNKGVSAPLRVCLCRSWTPGGDICPACSFLPDVSSAPDCTGTAIPGTPVNNTKCTPRRLDPALFDVPVPAQQNTAP